MNIELGILQLTDLSNTMQRVHNEGGVLKMYSFGTCICGWQFKIGSRENFNEVPLESEAYSVLDVLNNLDDSLGHVAAGSIYRSKSHQRIRHAIDSGLFTEEEAEKFNHLTSDNPTPLDAKNYIDAVIVKLREQLK